MLIIFDLDGTLFQTAICDINAVHKLFDEYGLSRIDEREITAGIGKKTADFLGGILPDSNLLEQACERFRELEQLEVKERGMLFPDISKMLQELRDKGHSLSICSNGSLKYIMLVLECTGIVEYFDNIKSAKYIGSKTKAVQQLLMETKNAVMVGDTISDFCAAQENQIPSIGVAYGYGNPIDLKQVTFIAYNTMQICEFVQQLEIFYNITDGLIKDGKRCIGINGVDASGKTTLTNNLSVFLNHIGIKNTIIHIDDFHNKAIVRQQGNNEIEAYYQNAFNYDQLIEEILRPIQNGIVVDKEVMCLNLDTDKYENAIHYSIDKETVVLIEGVLLFRPPLSQFLEGKVYVNISFDEVLRRARVRDVPKYGEEFMKKYFEKYIPIQKKYLAEYNPIEKSDFIIDNNDFKNPRLMS